MTTRNKPATCAICKRLFEPEDIREGCACGELFCYECPGIACRCKHDDPKINTLKRALRVAAQEVTALRIAASLVGLSSLSPAKQAHLPIMEELFDTLHKQVMRLEEIHCGEFYPPDEEMPRLLDPWGGR